MPRDNAHIIRSGGSDLTATENITFTVGGGNPVQRMHMIMMLIPSQSGTTPTLKVTVKSLTDGKEIEVTHTENIDAATTFPFELKLPLPPSDDTAWQLDLTLGGTTPDFGAVQAWLEGSQLAKVPAA